MFPLNIIKTSFFGIFLSLTEKETKKKQKPQKNMQKHAIKRKKIVLASKKIDQQMAWGAPVSWSKYTTFDNNKYFRYFHLLHI